jgi:hypothetical protein
MTAKKKLPQAHIRMQINDAVFDETGAADEVRDKLRAWLDEHLLKATQVIELVRERLEK